MSENDPPRDHAPGNGDFGDDSTSVEQHIKSRSTWLRLFFIVVYCFLYAISRIVVAAVVVVQFFWLLFKGETNERLLGLGQSLANYTYEIVRYLTFNSDVRPFPIDSDWPSARTGKADDGG
ncbi:MAG: DUF4389 domain-containing protein [Woeseiaceae bacterium]